MSESMEALSNRPENMEEIGAAAGKYSQILASKTEVGQTYTSLGSLLNEVLMLHICPLFNQHCVFRQTDTLSNI